MTFGVYLSAKYTRTFFKNPLEGTTFCCRRLIRLMGGGENNIRTFKAVHDRWPPQYLHDA